ncbi:MAG: HD-GYP domain-containing protein [Phycisphaerae bacterium]
MTLSEALVVNGRVMLQAGKALSTTDIGALQRRFGDLRMRVGDPILDDAVEFEDDSYERSVADEARRMVAESIFRINRQFVERASRGGGERFCVGSAGVDALHSSLEELMRFLKDHPTSAALITRCLDTRSYLAMHTGNTFYLSMLLGFKVLDYVCEERNRQTRARSLPSNTARDLTPLGLGTVAMDLGMLPLQHLFESDQPLSAADRRAIRDHPCAGAAMLPDSFSSVARTIVRTHHENYDGSGYPQGLEADKLHVFTRIVRIADAFDAATSDCVYKGAKSPIRVLWEMLAGPYRHCYDPKLMATFARLIQPFPVGAKLRLEDGRYAVVVRYNRRNPFKPTIVIAFDARNRPLPSQSLQEPLDLADHPYLRVMSFGDEDLSFVYKSPPEERSQPRQEPTTLLETAYP